jgi:hypothetical protein
MSRAHRKLTRTWASDRTVFQFNNQSVTMKYREPRLVEAFARFQAGLDAVAHRYTANT